MLEYFKRILKEEDWLESIDEDARDREYFKRILKVYHKTRISA